MGSCALKPGAVENPEAITTTHHKSIDSSYTSSLIKLQKVKVTKKRLLHHHKRSTMSCEKYDETQNGTSTNK